MPPKNKTAKKATPVKKAAAKKAPAKKAAASAKKPAAKSARKANAAFMKKMKPSPELAAVIGSTPVPRTEVTKQLWAYIKKHKLQDPAAKRTIIADEKLKKVFGGKKKVDMFEMTKLVNQHMSDA